jgi:hypothetical protein
MGYTTDFVGHININPPLNEHERMYLEAFRESRRFDRGGDPYEVPGNPAAERSAAIATQTYNTVAPGQPGYWCRWVPCWDGCCLALDGEEKIYQAERWLEYLRFHFLSTEAPARDSAFLDGFTFNHQLDGMVVGCRRDNKELFAIIAEDGGIFREVLRPADPRYLDYPPLPYEVVNDRSRLQRTRRSRRVRRDNVVAIRSPETW